MSDIPYDSPQHTPEGCLIQTEDGQLWLVETVKPEFIVYGRRVVRGYKQGHTMQITGDYRIVRRGPQVRLKTRPSMRAKHQVRREERNNNA